MDFNTVYNIILIDLSILLSASTIHFQSRSNLHPIEPCALSRKSILGRSKIWDRPCRVRMRANADQVSRIEFFKELASRERGPPKHGGYNPTYGFEPYWEWGDWVFDKTKSKKDESKMCGARCPELFLMFGPVCGVSKDFQYSNYDNYCHLRNEDCEQKHGLKMAYRGTCVPNLITYPTNSSDVIQKANNWINIYYKNTPTTTIKIPEKYLHGGK